MACSAGGKVVFLSMQSTDSGVTSGESASASKELSAQTAAQMKAVRELLFQMGGVDASADAKTQSHETISKNGGPRKAPHPVVLTAPGVRKDATPSLEKQTDRSRRRSEVLVDVK